MPALDSAALPLDCTMVLPRGLLRRRGHGAVHAGSHHLMKSPAFRTGDLPGAPHHAAVTAPPATVRAAA